MKAISILPNFLDIVQRYQLGEVVEQFYMGTEKQVFSRIYLVADDAESLREAVKFVHQTLKVTGSQNENLILDYYKV